MPTITVNENVVGARIGAFFIDALIWLAVFIVFSMLLGGVDTSRGVYFHLDGWPFVLYLALGIAYGTWLEAAYGGTVGKLILKITVINSTGEKPSPKQALIRNLMRLVDGFPYFIPYLVGIIAVATSPTKQRLGDRLAHTYVVRP